MSLIENVKAGKNQTTTLSAPLILSQNVDKEEEAGKDHFDKVLGMRVAATLHDKRAKANAIAEESVFSVESESQLKEVVSESPKEIAALISRCTNPLTAQRALRLSSWDTSKTVSTITQLPLDEVSGDSVTDL